MKALFFLFLSFQALSIHAQQLPVTTTWEGKMLGIRLVMRLSEDSLTQERKAFFDSPDQGGYNLAITELKIGSDSIRAYSPEIGGVFLGRFNKDKSEITGSWSQGGEVLPLTVKRIPNKQALRRPQVPKPPFPYREEKLLYDNSDNSIRFGATLTLPPSQKPLPVVILITGSGQQNRDEDVFGHKPFWVIADHLSRNGIAVLRVDDRGVGETTGEFAAATSADYAQDVLAGIRYLKTRKDIDASKIGLVGHSEGGIIAPLAANQSRDVAFIVSLAGVGITGAELMKKQMEDAFLRMGLDQEDLARIHAFHGMLMHLHTQYADTEAIKRAFRSSFVQWRDQQPEGFLLKAGFKGGDADKNIGAMAARTFLPWNRYLLNYDPANTIAKLTIPVLAMNGDKDCQVIARENLAGFEKHLTLAGNKDFKIVTLPGLNHFFQTAETGLPGEYTTIEETFAPAALKVMSEWIVEHVR